jgi:hypothetical protein
MAARMLLLLANKHVDVVFLDDCDDVIVEVVENEMFGKRGPKADAFPTREAIASTRATKQLSPFENMVDVSLFCLRSDHKSKRLLLGSLYGNDAMII